MDPFSFPAAILGSWIVVIVINIGSRYAREEIRTGVEPKGSTLFVFTCIGLGSAIAVAGHGFEIPFFYHLCNILTGALIGLGTAHFGPRIVRSLRRGQNQ